MARSPRREALIDTALDLFNREGFHATGIDRILAQSGVAKMTLYNHFASKDELILAALRRRDEGMRHWLRRAVEAREREPRRRPLAVFDALADWFKSRDFRGCLFIKAAAEFGDRNAPAHAAAAEHKRLLLGYLRQLAAAAGVSEPDRLARQLMLLVEGATAAAHISGDAAAAQDAKAAAQTLLRAELG
jgi:AcrR family transcriptional regulator